MDNNSDYCHIAWIFRGIVPAIDYGGRTDGNTDRRR